MFRTNTELIEIDIVVIDKAGQKVHGLAADHLASLDIRLPLAQLTPGAYRLQVVVTDGAMSDTREIGLVVR